MRYKWFNDERTELANSRADGLVFAQSFLHPLFDLRKVLVDRNQAQLAATLDQLIWLDDECLPNSGSSQRNEGVLKITITTQQTSQYGGQLCTIPSKYII